MSRLINRAAFTVYAILAAFIVTSIAFLAAPSKLTTALWGLSFLGLWGIVIAAVVHRDRGAGE